MAEETKTEEPKTEEKPEPKEEGTIVDKANAAADDLKKENERMEKNISELQNLQANAALGGRTGGPTPDAKPVEPTDEEYWEKVKKGEADPLKDDGFK